MKNASGVEIKNTKPTSAINKFQVFKAMGNTLMSLETATCVEKRETRQETGLKEKKKSAKVLLTGNHFSTIMNW